MKTAVSGSPARGPYYRPDIRIVPRTMDCLPPRFLLEQENNVIKSGTLQS